MADPLAELDAVGIAEAIRSGSVAPAEAVEAAARRIEALNPSLNAVVHPRLERAVEEARGKLPHGPFRGVPLLLKDLGCGSAGDPRHDGMRAARDAGWVEAADAPLTARFRELGFVILGRTNTPELGLLPTTEPEAHGPSRNPWDRGRSTGGSSGGAAAAVSAGMVPAAHASDSGGSIRIPASACGLVGLKPSRGRTPRGDAADTAFGVDHVLARSVRDAAAILDGLSIDGPGGFAAAAAGEPGRLRVGVSTTSPGGFVPTHPDAEAAALAVARLLDDLGHEVTEGGPGALADPDAGATFMYGLGVAFGNEAAGRLDAWSRRLGRPIEAGDVEVHTWALSEMGRATSSEVAAESAVALQGFADRVIAWWNGRDLLVTPTIAEPPPRLGEFVSTEADPLAAGIRAGRLTPFTTPFNVTGQPAISIPAAWNEDGLPIGVQLVAAPGREDVLIRTAAQLELALRWTRRRPHLAPLD